jgi:hypothetical protein
MHKTIPSSSNRIRFIPPALRWILLVASMIVTNSYVLARDGQCDSHAASLDQLKAQYQKRIRELPEADGQDKSSLPLWFRAYLRAHLTGLPTAGAQQYPGGSAEILNWLKQQKCASESELNSRLGALQKEIEEAKKAQILSEYPQNWAVQIKPGSKLDEVARQLEQEYEVLPVDDLQDRSPLPIWFRVYLRKVFPDLPTSGPYQYPRTANRILQGLLDHPDDVQMPISKK